MALPEARTRLRYEKRLRAVIAQGVAEGVFRALDGGHRPRGAVHAELDGALVQTRHGR